MKNINNIIDKSIETYNNAVENIQNNFRIFLNIIDFDRLVDCHVTIDGDNWRLMSINQGLNIECQNLCDDDMFETFSYLDISISDMIDLMTMYKNNILHE